MIMAGNDLVRIGPQLLNPFDPELVNPASIDIRIGNKYMRESGVATGIEGVTLGRTPVLIAPGERILVSTMEIIHVPASFAIELRLKSTRAREGWNHALAFWFDPGWTGIGTMELMNTNQRTPLHVFFGMKIAQIIVHQLSCAVEHGYHGRYQGATQVEPAKQEVSDGNPAV